MKKNVLSAALLAVTAVVVARLLFAPWGGAACFCSEAILLQAGGLLLIHACCLPAAGWALWRYVHWRLEWGTLSWVLLILAAVPGGYAMFCCPEFDKPLPGERHENPAAAGIPHPVRSDISITPYCP